MEQTISVKDSQGVATIERLTLNTREVCAALGVCSVTLWRLQQRNLLLPIPGLRNKLYSVKAVRRFAEQGQGAA